MERAVRLKRYAAFLPLLILIPCLHGLFGIRLAHREPSLHLLDRDHHFIAAVENAAGGFGYWDMPDTLPPTLVTATLAAEDRRFHDHFGVDPSATAGAFFNNYIRRKGYRGASTLAMQVARLQRGGGGGWYNKARDAVTAVGITAAFGRENVLRQYFRFAPYGNRIAGAACASRRYFHKPIQDLSLAEAALLASLPKAPSRLNPFNAGGFALAKRRAALVIHRAFAYGWISEDLRSGSLAELESLRRPVKEIRSEANFHFLREAVRRTAGRPHPAARSAPRSISGCRTPCGPPSAASCPSCCDGRPAIPPPWSWTRAMARCWPMSARTITSTSAAAPSIAPACPVPRGSLLEAASSTPWAWSGRVSRRRASLPISDSISAKAGVPSSRKTSTTSSWGPYCTKTPWRTAATSPRSRS